MNILVAGGAGFIGSHIVDAYAGAGHSVVVIDKSQKNIDGNKNPKAQYYCLDITKEDAYLDKIFAQHNFEVINNHAAQTSPQSSLQDPVKNEEQNTIITLKLLEKAKKYAIKKFIFASSAAVYGNPERLPLTEDVLNVVGKPINPYGVSKVNSENYLHMYNLLYKIDFVILRYANVYGPRQAISEESGVISSFIEKAVNNKPITIFGDGFQTRDFIFVKDIVQVNLKALDPAIKKQTCNIGTNNGTTIKQLAQKIISLTKSLSPLSHIADREGDIKQSVLDNMKAKKLLGLQTTPLDLGLEQTITWFKQQQKQRKETNENINIGIIGLGYVGLPLACLVAQKGYKTYALEINPNIVKSVREYKSHIKDESIQMRLNLLKENNKQITVFHHDETILNEEIQKTLKKIDIFIICVPTPVTEKGEPDLSYVTSAARKIKEHLRKNQLIIIESTIFPGTCEEVIIPIFEESGFKAGVDFHVAHCPERVDPGNKQWTLEKLPRVYSALNKAGKKLTRAFYESIIDAPLTELSSIKAAEAAKVVENTFRDINIAFVNELAQSFDTLGIDVTEVIKGASTKPFAFMPHYPGCGVGGHCIPVDPYYLIARAKQSGFEHRFMELARNINKHMPHYTLERLKQGLKEANLDINTIKIALLGLAYKGNVDDWRESPAVEIQSLLCNLLKENGNNPGENLKVYDPLLLKQSNVGNMQEALKGAEVIVLATDHKLFKEIDPIIFKQNNIKLIIDGRNCLDKEKIQELGIVYKGIGK